MKKLPLHPPCLPPSYPTPPTPTLLHTHSHLIPHTFTSQHEEDDTVSGDSIRSGGRHTRRRAAGTTLTVIQEFEGDGLAEGEEAVDEQLGAAEAAAEAAGAAAALEQQQEEAPAPTRTLRRWARGVG